ncbi:MAG: DUF4149 domain-containing protein [Pseudomonadales bacterium]|jgi:hypothetical protein
MLGDALILLTLGGMLFFPTVVAPTVFKTLPEADAGAFLRALFPRYYGFLILGTGAATLAFGLGAPSAALLTGSVTISTAAVLFLLVPKINALRDQQLAGDAEAGRAFDRSHRLSVAINFGQIALLIAALLS